MKIVVVGAGAVGGYFGGRLAALGEDVWFLARPETRKILSEKGLRVDSIAGDFRINPLQVSDDVTSIGTADLVLVAVKTWQVADVARQIQPLLNSESLVVPLQNGVDAADTLASVLGDACVVGGMCRILSHKVEPGWIHHTGSEPDIHFGTFDGSAHPKLEALQSLFSRAGVVARIHQDIRSVLWRKFLFVVTLGSVGSLVRAPIGVIREMPETRAMLHTCLEEILALAHAYGVALPAECLPQTLAFIDGLPPSGLASMQRDIVAGKPSELEAWTGAVVRRGREMGVATPLHHLIYYCLLPHEQRARGQLKFPE